MSELNNNDNYNNKKQKKSKVNKKDKGDNGRRSCRLAGRELASQYIKYHIILLKFFFLKKNF